MTTTSAMLEWAEDMMLLLDVEAVDEDLISNSSGQESDLAAKAGASNEKGESGAAAAGVPTDDTEVDGGKGEFR